MYKNTRTRLRSVSRCIPRGNERLRSAKVFKTRELHNAQLVGAASNPEGCARGVRRRYWLQPDAASFAASDAHGKGLAEVRCRVVFPLRNSWRPQSSLHIEFKVCGLGSESFSSIANGLHADGKCRRAKARTAAATEAPECTSTRARACVGPKFGDRTQCMLQNEGASSDDR